MILKHLKQLWRPTGYASRRLLCPHCVRAKLSLRSMFLIQESSGTKEGILTSARENTSAIRSRSVFRRACGSHHSAPFTHSDLENSCEKGAVARSPFDVQFISASTTDPVRRSSVGLRVVCVPLPSSCFELREALRFQHSIVDPSTSTKLTCGLSMLEKIISHRSRPMPEAFRKSSNSIYIAASLGTGSSEQKSARNCIFF